MMERIRLPASEPPRGSIITTRPIDVHGGENDDYEDFRACKEEANSFDPNLDSVDNIRRLTSNFPPTVLMADIYDGASETKNVGTVKASFHSGWPLMGGLAVRKQFRNTNRIGTCLAYSMCQRLFMAGNGTVELLADVEDVPPEILKTMTGSFHEALGFRPSYVSVGMVKEKDPETFTRHSPYFNASWMLDSPDRYIAAFRQVCQGLLWGYGTAAVRSRSDLQEVSRVFTAQADKRMADSAFCNPGAPSEEHWIREGVPHGTTMVTSSPSLPSEVYEKYWAHIQPDVVEPNGIDRRKIPLVILGLFTRPQGSNSPETLAGHYVAYDPQAAELIPFRIERAAFPQNDTPELGISYLDPEEGEGKHVLNELLIGAMAMGEAITSPPLISAPMRYLWDSSQKKLFTIDSRADIPVKYLLKPKGSPVLQKFYE